MENRALHLVPQVKEGRLLDGYADPSVPVETRVEETLGREGYRIQIRPDKIDIAGGSRAALAFADATLEQIRLQYPKKLPCLYIYDEPSCIWRSFHIDCARHFIPFAELKKMVRVAGRFKFNRFHWHFSDDQGWRIESRAFPLLHQVGAYRKGDHFGNYSSDGEEGGYYTREQVKELVDDCRGFGIEIVPEIDIPGHVTAVLAAYPQLCCRGASAGTSFEVATKAGIYPDILCPGKEGAFSFLERLLDDLLELFPGEYVHIGGDETPKSRWKECPDCARRMQEQGLSTMQQLQGYMANRVAAYLKTKGRRAIVWNETANGGNLDPGITVQLWNEDKERAALRHMQKGGKAIVSNMKNSYCDYPYAFISVKSLYDIDLEPEGTDAGKILGNECLIWTEYVRTARKLETLCWPRFCAAAEAGWCGKTRPGYEDFQKRLKTLTPLFERYGVDYTKEEGWVPQEEEIPRQIAEFMQNFKPEELEAFKKAQEEI